MDVQPVAAVLRGFEETEMSDASTSEWVALLPFRHHLCDDFIGEYGSTVDTRRHDRTRGMDSSRFNRTQYTPEAWSPRRLFGPEKELISSQICTSL